MNNHLNPNDMHDYQVKFENLEDLRRFNRILEEEGLYREVYESELRIIVLSIFPDTAEMLRSHL